VVTNRVVAAIGVAVVGIERVAFMFPGMLVALTHPMEVIGAPGAIETSVEAGTTPLFEMRAGLEMGATAGTAASGSVTDEAPGTAQDADAGEVLCALCEAATGGLAGVGAGTDA